MKSPLEKELGLRFAYRVPEERTVPYLLPESPEFQAMPRVLATGYMVGIIEWACIQALKPLLDWPAQQTVGTHVNLSHQAATPPGLTVTVEGSLLEVQGRKLTFAIVAHDGIDEISRGTHQRYVIDTDKFCANAAVKRTAALGKG